MKFSIYPLSLESELQSFPGGKMWCFMRMAKAAVPRIQSIFAIVSLLDTIGCKRNQKLTAKLMRGTSTPLK
jgi:hypothetical protein